MKKPSFTIREEIAKLQEQLKHAETREAERIGRIALRAGLGEVEMEEPDLQVAFEDLVKRFLAGNQGPTGRKGTGGGASINGQSGTVATGAIADNLDRA